MGEPMVVTSEPPARWSEPVEAYDDTRFAMSPYVHHFHERHILKKGQKAGPTLSGSSGSYFNLEQTMSALAQDDDPIRILIDAISKLATEFREDPADVLSRDATNTRFDPGRGDDFDDPAYRYLPDGALPDGNAGCIIGVIDDAIPFVHQQFTLPGHLSRTASVWLQDGQCRNDRNVGSDLPSGSEWRGDELSGMLAGLATGAIADEDAIYRLTGAVDMRRTAPPSGAFESGHGAAVAPLAAGFDPKTTEGRNHPLIAVCLPPRITADSMGTLAPVAIMTGILFIISRACGLCRYIERQRPDDGPVALPVVINLSLGLTAGPRDGSTPLERFMDAVSRVNVRGLGRICIVLPSGNHRQGRLRARLAPGQQVGWRIPPDDPTINAIEIWGPPYEGPPKGDLKITLTAPGLTPVTTAFTAARQLSVLVGPGGSGIAHAYYTPQKRPDGRYRDGIVIIAVPTCPEKLGEPFAPPGEWTLRIPDTLPQGDYDLSAQRDEVIRGFRKAARQSWFYDPAYRSHDAAGRLIRDDAQNGGAPTVIRTDTVNAYATGQWPLRAGAVYRQNRETTIYTSFLPGTTAADTHAGDCLVPVDISVNHPYMIVSGRGSGSFVPSLGTSMAAPHLSRWLARELARLADHERPDGRAAIRERAGQPDPHGPPPVVDPGRSYQEF